MSGFSGFNPMSGFGQQNDGFEPTITYEPSNKFNEARKLKKAATNIAEWFEKKKTEAKQRVEAIQTQLNTQQPGDVFSILKQDHRKYSDYDFFEWVVLYCEVKDTLIQLGKICFVDRKDDIIQNHGIIKNHFYSPVFIKCVNFLFPEFDDLLRTVLSKGYPGRDFYPSPLLMFERIIENINENYPLFGDNVKEEELTKYGVSFSLLPEFKKSIVSLMLNKAHEIRKKTILKMFNGFDKPTSIVSFWVKHGFFPQFHINKNANQDMFNVASLVASINETLQHNLTHDTLDVDIGSIFKYALLIKLNTHYQMVSDWTTRTLITPQFSSPSISRIGIERTQRYINTAWKFFDNETDKIQDYKERLYAYDDYFWNIEKKTYDIARGLSPEERKAKQLGGSKTKRQRKERQRKQKSKRKKTNS